MDEDFAYLIKKNGVPASAVAVSGGAAAAWNGKLPSGLLEFWRAYGIGLWAEGKFQFCNPSDYAGLVGLLLEGDPQFDPGHTHLIGFGAFGELVLWNETHQKLVIDLPRLSATADATDADWRPGNPNVVVTGPLVRIGNADQFTLFDNAGSPIFKRCVARCGKLTLGECYGFFPALALGGSTDVDSVKRVAAIEHFALLAQLGPIRLVDYPGGSQKFVRTLGRS